MLYTYNANIKSAIEVDDRKDGIIWQKDLISQRHGVNRSNAHKKSV
ncbi:hypothetical protein SKA53_07781 [Yoonia vestfoldensis SKA53]|uniref:Uncharacterized protein n=1 Tax=Yoonia vestfoldensis SKA53 TaxID=314232 RepID=A3V6X2_9RHOB|nr:hypothetical protein SKA53_07781 [Yoonia vestfoldensis SKA53]